MIGFAYVFSKQNSTRSSSLSCEFNVRVSSDIDLKVIAKTHHAHFLAEILTENNKTNVAECKKMLTKKYLVKLTLNKTSLSKIIYGNKLSLKFQIISTTGLLGIKPITTWALMK